MAYITYKTYHFQEPALIDTEVYTRLKQTITTQLHFQIYQPKESFTGHFKRSVRTFPFALILFTSVLVFMLHHGVPEKPLPGWWVALICVLLASGFIGMLALAHVVLEGRSYAVYLHRKLLYYTAMQYAIGKSRDYTEFKTLFFGPADNRKVDYKLLALAAPSIPKQPGALNHFLIRLFRILAKFSWLLILAVLVWVLWKHFTNR